MNLDTAIAILEANQLWRRGLPPYNEVNVQPFYTPKERFEAMDVILKTVKGIRDDNQF